MGFQSGINAMLGAVAGAAFGINKTLKDRQQEQNTKVKQQQEAKKAQRRNFMTYLKNVEVQGGGTVGQLPKKTQQAIAKQYSKSDRKKLMDRIDKGMKKNVTK